MQSYQPQQETPMQYEPSPYMQQTPVQQTANPGLPGWVKALIVVAIIVLIAYVLKLGPFAPAVVDAPLGGVVIPGTPSDKPMSPGTSTPVQVGTSPPLNANQVKSIVFTKDNTNSTEHSDMYTFQLGEVKVYDTNDHLLTASDFASAAYDAAAYTANSPGMYATAFPATNAYDGNPNTFIHTDGTHRVHQLILTLKNPTNISRLQVVNRTDCCQWRLTGTICDLNNTNGIPVKTFTLTADMVQNLAVSV